MENIDWHYQEMLRRGAKPQDARGILPTNVMTNILFKVNLRALADLLTVRLCIRAQGEFQNVARDMAEIVTEVHPWAYPVLGPECLVHGVCKFPSYNSCPISQEYPRLRGLTDDERNGIRDTWIKAKGYDPQPGVHDWKKE
jgi:thymidylate synthase ThyX